MLRIAICDDEALELAATRAMMEEFITLRGLSARIETFADGKSLLFAMSEPFDLYLLDVVMPEQNGVELGKELRKSDTSGVIVYLTTSPDFAIESYDAQAFHYLLKPVKRERLYEVLDRAVAALKRRDECVYVKTRDGTVRLLLDDIYYAELLGRAARYVCRDAVVDSMTSSASFREMAASLLADGRFYLCGASLALNLGHVRMVDRSGALLSTGQRIEVPRLTAGALYLAWSNYWLEGGGQS